MSQKEIELEQLDARVAEAVGIVVTSTGDTKRRQLESGVWCKWRPSTDWNDAMEAAERVKLFENETLLTGGSGGWAIGYCETFCGDGFTAETIAETGPLAVCMAILKLKTV